MESKEIIKLMDEISGDGSIVFVYAYNFLYLTGEQLYFCLNK